LRFCRFANAVSARRDVDATNVTASYKDADGEVVLSLPPRKADGVVLPGTKVEVLSDLIFMLAGKTPPMVRRSKLNEDSELSRLTIRDLLWFCYLDQDTIDSDFFHLGADANPFKGLKSRDVLRFIVGFHQENVSELESQLEDIRLRRMACESAADSMAAAMAAANIATSLELEAARRELTTESNRIAEEISAIRSEKSSLRPHGIETLQAEGRALSEQISGTNCALNELQEECDKHVTHKNELKSLSARWLRSKTARAVIEGVEFVKCPGCTQALQLDNRCRRWFRTIAFRGALTSDHPDPVASTWALSFENIEKNPPAAELLRFCAFLHPDEIPEELFSEGATELGPVLGAVGSEPLALDSAIAEILKYSLLRRDPNARTLEIHRLVQTVLKQAMDETTQRLWAERAIRAMNRVFPFVEFSNWALCDRLLPQAQACAELINQQGFRFADAALLLSDVGFYLYKRGRYVEAEPLFDRALAIYERVLGPEHPDVANSLNNLTRLYRAQGRYVEAEPLCERALAIREKTWGSEHPDVVWSLNNLADLYRSQGRYAKAEPLYRRALAIREKALGSEHPDLATSLNNLAALYQAQGQYAKAEPFYQRALAIYEKALGPEHPWVATCLENYALGLRNMGRPEEAEPLEARARARRAKST
jgi:tetratricopeptide (TPR) repeat protein